MTDWLQKYPFRLKQTVDAAAPIRSHLALEMQLWELPLAKSQVVSKRKLSFREMWSPPVFHQPPQQKLAKVAEWPVFASSAHYSTSLGPEMGIWWGRTGKEKPVFKELMRKPPYWFWHTYCSNHQKRVRPLFHPHHHSYLVNWQGFRTLPVFPHMQKNPPLPPAKKNLCSPLLTSPEKS